MVTALIVREILTIFYFTVWVIRLQQKIVKISRTISTLTTLATIQLRFLGLSTLPSIASALLGNILGIFLISSRTKKQQLQGMIAVGLILSTLGWLWGFIFPINKSLWTSSYVLWTGGLALLVFALLFCTN